MRDTTGLAPLSPPPTHECFPVIRGFIFSSPEKQKVSVHGKHKDNTVSPPDIQTMFPHFSCDI